MRRLSRWILGTLLTVAGTAFAEPILLLQGSTLTRIDSSNPSVALASVNLIGLQPGETMRAIDFRPKNGKLYGLGSTSRLYQIDAITGVVTAVGAGPFANALSGNVFGLDFDPVTDKARVVSDSGQNFRIDPDSGAAPVPDAPLKTMGLTVGGTSLGHTNNVANASSTTAYFISSTSSLYRLGSVGGSPSSPNDGVVTEIGPLNTTVTGLGGFDISATGTAYAALRPTGAGEVSRLYTVDLATGIASMIGTFPDAAAAISGLAIGGPLGDCTLDFDGNNSIDALTDGLLALRAMFGLTGPAVMNNAVGTGATRSTWAQLRQHLNGNCGGSFAP